MAQLFNIVKLSVPLAHKTLVRTACGDVPRITGCTKNKKNLRMPEKPQICKKKEIPRTRQEKCLKCPEEKLTVPCGLKKSKNPPKCEGSPCDHLKKGKRKELKNEN